MFPLCLFQLPDVNHALANVHTVLRTDLTNIVQKVSLCPAHHLPLVLLVTLFFTHCVLTKHTLIQKTNTFITCSLLLSTSRATRLLMTHQNWLKNKLKTLLQVHMCVCVCVCVCGYSVCLCV